MNNSEALKQIIFIIKENLSNLCNINSPRYSNNLFNTDIRKKIFQDKILSDKKTFEDIGNSFGCSRQNIQQQKEKIDEFIEKEMDNIHAEINDIASILIENKLLFINDEAVQQLEPYKNIINNYLNKDFSNQIFIIDLDNKVIYDKKINLKNLYTLISNMLIDNNIYEYDFIKKLISVELNKISIKNSEVIENFTKIFIAEKIKNNNFVNISSDEKNIYIYKEPSISNKELQNIKLTYWFKQCFPSGVSLPQQNAMEGIKNLEPLIQKIPNLSLTNKQYRYFLEHKICKNDEIAVFDTGKYIHFDYYRELYKNNKDFVNELLDKLKSLYSLEYNSLKIWSVFNVKSIKTEFLKLGITTHEILYNILRASNSSLYKFQMYNRSLLITLADTDEKNLRIKYEGNKIVSTSETETLLDFLKHAKFNNNVNFNFKSNINIINSNNKSVDNISENDIENEYNDIPTDTRESIVKQRIGQDKLRDKMLEQYSACELCGITSPELLVASHIKPWHDCDNKIEQNERGSLNNVFLLCAMHDKLFDKGLISFTDSGEILISSKLTKEDIVKLNLSKFCINFRNEIQKMYVKYHRDNIFTK